MDKKHRLKKSHFLIAAIILAVIILLNGVSGSHAVDLKVLSYIINAKHPNHKIDSLKLQYIGQGSTICDINEDRWFDAEAKATLAEAVVKSDKEQRTMRFEKKIWFWFTESDVPDNGPNLPENKYYLRKEYHHVSKYVEIEEWVQGRYIIPTKDGNLYEKHGDDNWYWSVVEARSIYRTNGGRVYSLNKRTLRWEPSDTPYSDLKQYSNYEHVSEEEVQKIIKRVTSE